MKKITLILLTFLFYQYSYSQCEFAISLSDTYGDGWVATGAAYHTIDVVVGGTVVLDDITINNGTAASYTFEVSNGDLIDVVFTDGGNWAGECGYTIYNNIGEAQTQQQGAGGGAGDAGPADTTALEAVCSDGCPPPQITQWQMTSDGASFDGYNQEGVIGYQIEYSTSPFTGGDGTAMVYEFESFPHEMSGVLEGSTTYYMTIRSVCGEDNYSGWSDNGNDGPDQWTTSSCLSVYTLPYFNDFGEVDATSGNPTQEAIDAWSSCNTFYNFDSDTVSPGYIDFWHIMPYDAANGIVAASYSWYNGTILSPDNWFVLGPIDLTNVSDAMLEWDVIGPDASYCSENYSVYVGPSSNSDDLLNSPVYYNETIASGGDGCGSWGARSFDISGAVGEEVYIAFRHHDITDMYVMLIDNVSVTSNTMSNEEFTLENIDYTFNQESSILRVNSEELLSEIEIHNLLGQQVLFENLNSNSINLDLSNLSSGVYIVNVEGNNSKTKTFKLAIK